MSTTSPTSAVAGLTANDPPARPVENPGALLDRVTHRRKLKDELVTILRILLGESPAVRGDLPAPEPAVPVPETTEGDTAPKQEKAAKE